MNDDNGVKGRFIDSWGEMGSAWGINKTMARIHALLMAGEEALSTEQVMEELAISRGNANMNLRALVDWGLARRVAVKGERKEFFQSEKDVWHMFCRIARERKRRELEPALEALQECLALAGKDKASPHLRQRLQQLLDLTSLLDSIMGKVAAQEANKLLPKLLKLVS